MRSLVLCTLLYTKFNMLIYKTSNRVFFYFKHLILLCEYFCISIFAIEMHKEKNFQFKVSIPVLETTTTEDHHLHIPSVNSRVTLCQKREPFEQAGPDVKYPRLNSNTQRHFSQIELSASPLGKKRGGKILPSHLVIIKEMRDRRG